MVHLHYRGDPFGCADPEDRDLDGVRNRVAVHGDHTEAMAGHCEAADFTSAPVQDVKQDTLPFPDADRLAMPEHTSIDREELIADLVTLRHAAFEGRVHDGFALLLEGSDFLACEEVHGHIAAAAERWRELL